MDVVSATSTLGMKLHALQTPSQARARLCHIKLGPGPTLAHWQDTFAAPRAFGPAVPVRLGHARNSAPDVSLLEGQIQVHRDA